MIRNSISLYMITLMWWCTGLESHSQVAVSGYLEAGHTSNLEGYAAVSILPAYQYKQISAEIGFSALPSRNRETFINGLYLQGAYEFHIKDRSLVTQLKYLWKPVSNEIREINLAVAADFSLDHWYFLLGNNFRRYGFRKSYRESQGYDRDESTITEPWNLMYTVTFQIFPPEHNWNLSGSITNIDYFIFEQETNPMVNIKGTFRPVSNIDLFLESWYKSAGFFNIQVNYYGFFFRFGVTWTIGV